MESGLKTCSYFAASPYCTGNLVIGQADAIQLLMHFSKAEGGHSPVTSKLTEYWSGLLYF